MKRRFRLIALVMAAAVFCALPAGCSNTGAAAGSAAASSAGETAESAESVKKTVQASASDHMTAEAAENEEAESSMEEVREDLQKSGSARTAEEAAESGTGSAAEKERSRAAAEAEPEEAADGASAGAAMTAEEEAADSTASSESSTGEPAAQDQIDFDGESDLEYNARQILLADDTITKEGALGVAAYLWQMGFGRMSGYPTISQVNNGKVLTVFDENGLFYNIFLTPEGKIQQVEDVEGNELISLGTRAGELVKPPVSGADVIALLEEWGEHGGHAQVVSAYNKFAGDYGRSKMSGDDQWCSETVSAAYAVLGAADKIGGMASNGNTYESNARSIGAWVSGGAYIPNTGDILITHDSAGERHTACVVSCDGHTIRTIAGGGSGIHHSSISVGSGRITGFVVPEW